MALNKPLTTITEDDLLLLRFNKEPESPTLDYKEHSWLTEKGDPKKDPKEELRFDISSFANASGGHVIIGMKEANGYPTALSGTEIPDPESFKNQVTAVLDARITPRILGVETHIIDLKTIPGKQAAIVRIPQSFIKPHQVLVANKDDFRFYGRKEASKSRLDVGELRSIFIQSEALVQQIKNFRLERLGNIMAGETPVRLRLGPRAVVHLVPLSAFNPAVRYDLAALAKPTNQIMFSPHYDPQNWFTDCRYNLDGVYASLVDSTSAGANSYLQVFRNGILETVEAEIINRKMPESTVTLWKHVDEQVLIRVVERGLGILKHLEVEPPLILFVTLMGMKGGNISIRNQRFQDFTVPFDRDTFMLPDVPVDDFDLPADRIVKPILDTIWNAGGHEFCGNYDDAGNFMPIY